MPGGPESGGKRFLPEYPEGLGIEGRTEGRNVEAEQPPLSLVGIYTAPEKGKPMVSHESIMAIAGEGLEGDRYNTKSPRGLYAGVRIPDADRQVTLIARGGIDDANADLQAGGYDSIRENETRRNLVVDMKPEQLNALIGKQFTVGNVVLEAVEEATPCAWPPRLLNRSKAGEKAFQQAFTNRGGIRARVVTSGEIRLGDKLAPTPAPARR